MFERLCMLAEELMPDATKTQIGLEMVEFRRDDGQFLLLGMSFYAPKHPVVVLSVFEGTASRMGVTAGTTSLRVNGCDVTVTRCMEYVNQPERVTISYRGHDLGCLVSLFSEDCQPI